MGLSQPMPCPMAVSTTMAMATLVPRPSSPPSTTMARGLLMPSLLPMLMLMPTLGWPTDTTAMDSSGHTDTDTAATTVDIPMEDTGPTDIPTTDKDIAARFLYGYLPRYYPNVFREPISKC